MQGMEAGLSWDRVFLEVIFPAATLLGLYILYKVALELAKGIDRISNRLEQIAEHIEADSLRKDFDRDDSLEDEWEPELKRR